MEIVKPMSVIRQEFAEKLVEDINNSLLPLFVIEPILQDALDAVKAAAQKQYEVEKAQYEQQLYLQNTTDSNKEE
jgi:hypothetical protein